MKEENKFDVIIIGSGIGGLTVASLLARYKGWRCLVLEKNFNIGGQTHCFELNKNSYLMRLALRGRNEPRDLTSKSDGRYYRE